MLTENRSAPLFTEDSEEVMKQRIKMVAALKQDAESLIVALIPDARTIESVYLLQFFKRAVENLLQCDLWDVHTRFLKAELISCRHVLVCSIHRLEMQDQDMAN
jgi:lipid A disaccharide synthetase